MPSEPCQSEENQRSLTHELNKDRYTLVLLAAGLLLYSVALTILSGDFGFEGDDWWIFSYPYWHNFSTAVVEFTRHFLRPLEGIYWISLFEVFGFNRIPFHLLSLLLAAGASVLMGACLSKAFPRDRTFVTASVLLAFFMPTVSCLTYVLATDNSRLSMVLFWGCVLAFQRWVEKSCSWTALGLPILLYAMSFFTYEAPSFLIFTVPFFVIPLWQRLPRKLSVRSFHLRLFATVGFTFGLGILSRFLILGGGEKRYSNLFPPLDLVWSYIALLPHYVAAPFLELSTYFWAWILGIAVAIWACILLFREREEDAQVQSELNLQGEFGLGYAILMGAAILVLGMVPYQLAGYGSTPPTIVDTVLAMWGRIPDGHTAWFNFNWSSRVYSAASPGLAIILAALATGWPRAKLQPVLRVGIVCVVALMAVFHAGLSADWKEAARQRNEILDSLVKQVPGLKADTNLVLLGFNSFHRHAPIFRGWGGLRELMRMVYEDRSVGAFYLYPCAWKQPNHLCQQAVVSREGFVSRGVALNRPLPHDRLLVLRRSGSRVAFLDRLRANDGLVSNGVLWKGVKVLRSNKARIASRIASSVSFKKRKEHGWPGSVLTAFGLDRQKLGETSVAQVKATIKEKTPLQETPIKK
ncbi:MAG: hypothetical protein AB1664_12110 [Thermodesulfobacteriota bacterium]